MKWFEILILVLVISYCTYIIFRKKKRNCCGNCGGCQGCNQQTDK